MCGRISDPKNCGEREKAMICPNCQKELPANTRFCTHCGCELKKEMQKAVSRQKADATAKQRKPIMGKIIGISLAALVCVAAVWIGWPRVHYGLLMRRGAELVQQGENREAIPLLEEAVALNPKEEQAYAYLAKAYFATGPTNNEKGWDTLAAGRRKTGGFQIMALDNWEEGLGEANWQYLWQRFEQSWWSPLDSVIYLGINDAGKIEQLVAISSSSTWIYANFRFEYDPEGKLLWERAYSSEGELMWSIKYSYNEHGQLETKERIHNRESWGERTWFYLYESVETKAPYRIEIRDLWTEDGVGHNQIIKTEYQRDPEGKLQKEEIEFIEDGTVEEILTREYNSEERLTQKQIERRGEETEGATWTCYNFVYDKNGVLTQIWNNKGERTGEIEYDDQGRVVRRTGPSGITVEYQFDEMGNRVTERNWVTENTLDLSTTTYEYTPQGRLIRMVTTASYARPYIDLFEYDPDGRVIRIKTSYDGGCWYEYDPDGGAKMMRDEKK